MKITALAFAFVAVVAACSSEPSQSRPACVGKNQGEACAVAEDCKPATCKCIDGMVGDAERACLNGACDAHSDCELRCRTHFGIDEFLICS